MSNNKVIRDKTGKKHRKLPPKIDKTRTIYPYSLNKPFETDKW
jgi:hypothetical protein